MEHGCSEVLLIMPFTGSLGDGSLSNVKSKGLWRLPMNASNTIGYILKPAIFHMADRTPENPT